MVRGSRAMSFKLQNQHVSAYRTLARIAVVVGTLHVVSYTLQSSFDKARLRIVRISGPPWNFIKNDSNIYEGYVYERGWIYTVYSKGVCLKILSYVCVGGGIANREFRRASTVKRGRASVLRHG